MIQIITKNTFLYKNKFINKEIVISSFSQYKSFDLYDINIINLASNDLWESNSSYMEYLNDKSDLLTIKNSIKTSNTKILIFFPQNCYFNYDFSVYSKKFQKRLPLKSITETVNSFITKYIYDPLPKFNYEKGISEIDGETYNSDFYFNENEGILLCKKSKKINTMNLSDRLIISTLDLFETPVNNDLEKRMFVFLNKIGFLIKNEIIPQWIDDIHFHDDYIYEEKISECNEEISKLKSIIIQNEQKLEDNLKYKRILYSSGHVLSSQINEMLKKIFQLNDDFIDVYEEDFNFKLEGVTFIVETKGLNNEVSGQNVSDAYNHLVIYEDNLEKKDVLEKTKCLFFVANERFICPKERTKIKERQVTIAKRNKTLIIETTTFYKIFEDFMRCKISVSEILTMFKENEGLLKYEKGTDEN